MERLKLMEFSLRSQVSFITWTVKGKHGFLLLDTFKIICSPLVLAALWDVTDKDIDTYIKEVLDNSGLLENRATLQAINQEAHASRGICYLKALNGFAPIVYGPYIK